VTHAFPDDGSDDPDVWVAGTVNGTRAPRLPVVALRGTRTIATSLPIVALAAYDDRAAVAQGLGGPRDFRGPLGPIVVWNPVRGTASQIPTPGCGSAYEVDLASVFFTAGGVGYRCDDPAISYGEDDTLRLVQRGRGSLEIVHTRDGEFSGAFLDGLAEDGNEIAFDVGILGTTARGDVYQARSRIWKASRARKAVVRTFRGEATVVSLDAGRIAVLRDGQAVSVILPGGKVRTFAFGRVVGATLAYFDSIGLNHELLSPTGTDAINFNTVGIPASGLLTGQDCCKSQKEVDLFGGYLGNYEGNIPSFDGGCVDNPFRWCDNLANNDPAVLTFMSKAFASMVVQMAFDTKVMSASSSVVYNKKLPIAGDVGRRFVAK
jgi:hypothetical protein